MGGDQGRPRSEKGIKDDVVSAGHVLDRVGHQGHRLYGRMHPQQLVPIGAEGVHAPIAPEVRPRAPFLSQLEIVDVRRIPLLQHQDELVLGSVEAAHAGVGLGPNAQVHQGEFGAFCRREQLREMAPVHADVADRPIPHHVPGCGEKFLEKRREGLRGHFARRERELPVASASRHEAVDLDVVRGVREHHLRLGRAEQSGHHVRVATVPAGDVVVAHDPDIARSSDGRRRLRLRRRILHLAGCHLPNAQADVDLDGVKAGQLHVEAEIDQVLEFDTELVLVPLGVCGDPIQRQANGPNLGRISVADNHDSDLVMACVSDCVPDGMAIDDHVLVVDDDRGDLAKAADASCELAPLTPVVSTRCSIVVFQRPDGEVFDLKFVGVHRQTPD